MNSKLRVYVAPCGIGLGHVARCEPIAKALAKQGHEIVFSTYLDGLEYATTNGFRLVKSYPIGFRVKQDGTVDFKLTAATSGFSLGVRRFLRQTMQEIRNLQRFRPHVVLSDSRASSLLAAKLMGIPSILLLNQYRVDIVRRPSNHKLGMIDRFFFFFANLSWIFLRTLLGGVWARSDKILIPDFPPPHTVSASNLTIPTRYHRKVSLIGPIIPEANSTHVPRNQLVRGLGAEPSRPLVYAAISGPKIERTYLANLLISELSKLGGNYTVVLSRGDPSGSRTLTRVGNLIVFGWLEDQLSYLKACDLVISRAGHGMITKAIALGKPMILIPIPDHTEQHGNAERVQALGLGVMIEQYGLTVEELDKAATQLLERRRTIENGQLPKPMLGDGTGSAVQIIASVSGLKRHQNSLGAQ